MIYFLKQTRWIAFAYVLSLFCCWGCGCRLKYQKKIDPKPLLSVKNTVSQLLKKRDIFRDIRGRVAISVIRPGGKRTFSANVILDSYSRFRIEGLGFLNIPYFFLVADGKWIQFYVPDEHKILKGEYSEDNLFRLTGIKSTVENLVALFSGNLPYTLSSPRLKFISSNGKQQVIELRSDQKELYRLWIDYQQRAMVKMEVYGADQKLLLQAWFDDYETIDDYTWPKKIECNFTSSQILLKIKYKQLFVNSGVTEKDFLLQYPQTTIIENLEN